jgi:gluconate 2-dehydrogenase gamma chain
MKRRAFLVGAGGAVLPFGWRPRPAAADLPDTAWRTLAAVLAHLFPSEAGAPGAAEIDALAYIGTMLEAPGFDAGERTAILRGAAEIETLAAGRAFAELAPEAKETVLRAFEATEHGRRWLSGMLNYLVEALLADPVYGGNPDGIGWRWLAHNPGFPRPPAGKRWFLLKQV